MNLFPIRATNEVHREAMSILRDNGNDTIAELMEQYRIALMDICTLASLYAQPDQQGSPLEQVLHIAMRRGLGITP